MSPTLLRIAGMPNYWSNINLRNELPVLENYLFPEIFSNLFDKNVMQNAAVANNRKEYPRRSAVSSCCVNPLENSKSQLTGEVT
jgi:hypothetical protein